MRVRRETSGRRAYGQHTLCRLHAVKKYRSAPHSVELHPTSIINIARVCVQMSRARSLLALSASPLVRCVRARA